MECKLKRKEEKHILGWLGKPSWKLELLFSAVKDGCDPAVFHRLCDKKGDIILNTLYFHSLIFSSLGGL